MIYFILFVSIANLVLGYATAWICQRRCEPLSASSPNLSAVPLQGRERQDQDIRSAPASPTAAMSREQLTLPVDESRGQAAAAWSRPKTWSDLSADIQSLLDRARYTRSAGDKRLAWETAGQLREFAESWCATLQPRLADCGSACTSLPGGEVVAAQVEMWVAQLETTLRNLSEMEPTETADAVLDRVERELEALERNSPLVGKSAI